VLTKHYLFGHAIILEFLVANNIGDSYNKTTQWKTT